MTIQIMQLHLYKNLSINLCEDNTPQTTVLPLPLCLHVAEDNIILVRIHCWIKVPYI